MQCISYIAKALVMADTERTTITLTKATRDRLDRFAKTAIEDVRPTHEAAVALLLDQVEGKQRRGASRSGGAAAP